MPKVNKLDLPLDDYKGGKMGGNGGKMAASLKPGGKGFSTWQIVLGEAKDL